MEPAEAQHHIDAMLLAWIGHELGQTVSFTASDLAQLAGCDGQETGAYLSAFSIEFGEQPSHSGEIDIEDVRGPPDRRGRSRALPVRVCAQPDLGTPSVR